MQPLATASLEQESEVNYRLSRARRCVENAFGILAIGAKRISREVYIVCRRLNVLRFKTWVFFT